MAMKPSVLVLVLGVMLWSATASAGSLSISLAPDAGDPISPQMGDTLSFHTVIRNDADTPVTGLIAWIGLVRIDKGKEQPVDLEDWSAHKVVTATSLAPGQTLVSDWPMRLIEAGAYRVAVSATTLADTKMTPSPFIDFTVRQKPVVESRRVLPVALGLPLLIGIGMLLVRRERRGTAHGANEAPSRAV
jgi:hypothetical protein